MIPEQILRHKILVIDSRHGIIWGFRGDLLNQGINVVERPWIGFGESFVFEVVFEKEKTCMLTIFRCSESIRKKYYKQSNSFNFRIYNRLRTFSRYIDEHHELPYAFFEYFNYRFLLLAKKDDSFKGAVYGEYKFKATKNDISIIDKKIVFLQNEKAIVQKYDSYF